MQHSLHTLKATANAISQRLHPFAEVVIHDLVKTFNTAISFFQNSPSTSHQIEDQRTHITAAACGSVHTILLDTHGRVYACGKNDKGQLGLGHKTMKNTFTQVTSLNDVEIEHVVCGGAHTFLFDKEGKIYGCGRNQEGQLALSNMKDQNTFTRVQTFDGKKQLFCNYHETMLIKSEEENQPNIENGNAARMMERALELDGIKLQHGSCGRDYIMVLDESGRVHARGGNIEGQLGLGYKTDQQHFQLVEIPDNKNVKQVACGDDYTLLLRTNNSLYACGANYDNQLPCLAPNKSSQPRQDSSRFTTFQCSLG